MQYQQSFNPNEDLEEHTRRRPEAMAAVGVICAESDAEAQHLYASVRLLQLRIRQGDRRPVAAPEDAQRELAGYGPLSTEKTEFPRTFVGTPDKVRKDLTSMAQSLGIWELVVNTITHDHEARLRSYDLLAEAFSLSNADNQASDHLLLSA